MEQYGFAVCDRKQKFNSFTTQNHSIVASKISCLKAKLQRNIDIKFVANEVSSTYRVVPPYVPADGHGQSVLQEFHMEQGVFLAVFI